MALYITIESQNTNRPNIVKIFDDSNHSTLTLDLNRFPWVQLLRDQTAGTIMLRNPDITYFIVASQVVQIASNTYSNPSVNLVWIDLINLIFVNRVILSEEEIADMIAGGSTGVTSWNGRTGNVVMVSSDVTNALGYTPFPQPTGTNLQYITGAGNLLTFPTNVSQFNNDAGYITASSHDNLTNKTGLISMWTNDVGYLTAATFPGWQQGGNSFGAVGILGTLDAYALQIISNSINALMLDGTSNVATFWSTVSGKVKIGSGADTGKTLQVNGGGSFTGTVTGANATLSNEFVTLGQLGASGYVQGGNSFGATGVLGLQDNFDLVLITNNLERARIKAGGNFLIGTSTDSGQRFQVSGTSKLTGTSTAVSGLAQGTLLNGTLSASAIADNLVGLDINYTYSLGSFTSTNQYLIRALENNTQRFVLRDRGALAVIVRTIPGTEVGAITMSGDIGVPGIFLTTSTNARGDIRMQSSTGGLVFGASANTTQPLPMLSILNNGNVIIQNSSTSPTDNGNALQVSGTASISTSVITPIVAGSTVSGGTLTLNSTTNTTKGFINFGANSAYDEVNIRLGIGTTTPGVITAIIGSAPNVNVVASSGTAPLIGVGISGNPVTPDIRLGSFCYGTYSATSGLNTGLTATWDAYSEAGWTGTSKPTYMMLRVVPSGSTTLIQALRITSSQQLIVGNITLGTGVTATINTNGEARAAGGFNLNSPTNPNNQKYGMYLNSSSIQIFSNSFQIVNFNPNGSALSGSQQIFTTVFNHLTGQSGTVNGIGFDSAAIRPIGNNTVVYNLYNANIAIDLTTFTAGTLRGFNFEPTITSGSSITYIGFRNTIGNNIFNETSGNTLIGTATDSGIQKLQVNGRTSGSNAVLNNEYVTLGQANTLITTTAFVQNGNSFGALATLGTNDNNALAFETNGTEKARITASGNVLIGTTTDNGRKLQVSGDMSLDGMIFNPTNNTGYTWSNHTNRMGGSIFIGDAAGRLFTTATAGGKMVAIGLATAQNVTSVAGTAVVIGPNALQSGTTSLSDVTWIGGGALNTPASLSNAIIITNGELELGDGSILPSSNFAFIGGGYNFGLAVMDFTLGGSYSSANAANYYTRLLGTKGRGTDISGSPFYIQPGRATGAGISGDFIIEMGTTGTSGTTLQTLAQKFIVKGGSGNVLIGSTTDGGQRLQVTGDGYISGRLQVGTYTPSVNMTSTIHTNGQITATGGYSLSPATTEQASTPTGLYLISGSVIIKHGGYGVIKYTQVNGSTSGNVIQPIQTWNPPSGSGTVNLYEFSQVGVGPNGANSVNYRIFHINPLIVNGTFGSGTITGVNFEPNVVSLNNAPVVAFRNTIGNNQFNVSSGNTLIGTAVDSGQKFQVSGNGYISSSLQVGNYTAGAGVSATIHTTGTIAAGGGFNLRTPTTDNIQTGMFLNGANKIQITYGNTQVVYFSALGVATAGIQPAQFYNYTSGTGSTSSIDFSQVSIAPPSGTNSVSIAMITINPQITNAGGGTGTGTLYGVNFAPVIVSNTAPIVAYRNTIGNNIFNETSGNTLIGTATDSGIQKLQVNGRTSGSNAVLSNEYVTLGQLTSTAYVQGGNTFGAVGVLGLQDNFDLSFITNNTEKVRITASGMVGIGTTVPLYDLVVSRNAMRASFVSTGGVAPLVQIGIPGLPVSPDIRMGSVLIGQLNADGSVSSLTAGIQAYTTAAWTTSSKPTYLTIYTTATGTTGATEAMRVTSTSNLLIGGTVDNGLRLQVTGDIGATVTIKAGTYTNGTGITATIHSTGEFRSGTGFNLRSPIFSDNQQTGLYLAGGGQAQIRWNGGSVIQYQYIGAGTSGSVIQPMGGFNPASGSSNVQVYDFGLVSLQPTGSNTITYTMINVNPVINNTTFGGGVIRGVNFEPLVQSQGTSTFVPFRNTVGDNLFNVSSGRTIIASSSLTDTYNKFQVYAPAKINNIAFNSGADVYLTGASAGFRADAGNTSFYLECSADGNPAHGFIFTDVYGGTGGGKSFFNVTSSFVNIPAVIASPNANGRTMNILYINPTFNNTSAFTATARGIYYNPTLTAWAGTHIAAEFTIGNVIFNSTSGNTIIGTNVDNGNKLQVAGTMSIQGLVAGYVAKTANYTLTTTDYTVDCTTGSFTVTLPTAVGVTGQIYNIINSGSGTITVATTSSQTIGNTSSDPTSININPGSNMQVQSTGANWRIL